MPSRFHFRSPKPLDDPAVVPIELVLGASRRVEAVRSHERPLATHALWICACVTEHDAPSWLIYDVADSGLIWCRVPDSQEPLDLVDARFTAGGHADPAEVLRWLHGEASEPWGRLGDGGGDSRVLEGLRKRIAVQ